MTDKYIKMKVSDLREMVLALWEEYSEGGAEDSILSVPINLGLIENRTLTKADIENNTFDFVNELIEVGDWYYYILTHEEIYKKLEINKR